MQYTCKYCNKSLVFDKKQQIGAHVRNCQKNPNKEQILKKIALTKNIIKNKYSIQCAKCGKKFTLQLTQYVYNSGKYRKHCSRTCANIRNIQEKTKRKIQLSLLAYNGNDNIYPRQIQLTCKFCNKKFLYIQKSKRSINNYCSKRCKSLYNQVDKSHLSQIFKQQWKNGRLFKGGCGWSKWIQVETSNGIIKVQGSYQQRMCKILDKMKEIGDIQDWQYTNDRISYVGIDNKEHSYLLDFKVYHNDQSIRYIQTKGRVQENDYCKWTATKQKGFNLQICFQKDIKDYEIKYNI